MIPIVVEAAAGRFEIEVDLGSRRGTSLADLLGTWGLDAPETCLVDGRPCPSTTDVDDIVWYRGTGIDLVTEPGSIPVPGGDVSPPGARGTVPWRRQPRMEFPVTAPPVRLPADRPEPAPARRFGLAAVGIPMVFAAVMAVLWNPMFALFALLGPVMAVAGWSDDRRRVRRQSAGNADLTLRDLRRLADEIDAVRAFSRSMALRTHPPMDEVKRRIVDADRRLWERRPAHQDFMRVSVGIGCVPWSPRTTSSGSVHPAAEERLAAATVLHESPVPLVLASGAVVGVAGDVSDVGAVMSGLVLQIVVHHGPADVALTLVTDRDDAWDWMKWIPHLAADADGTPAVATDPAAIPLPRGACEVLVVDVADLASPRWTALRDRMATVAGAVLVAGTSVGGLPGATSVVIDTTSGSVAEPATGLRIDGVALCRLARTDARRVAAGLARFHDPDTRDIGGDLPATVRLLDVLGCDASVDDVLRRWQSHTGAPILAAPIGVSSTGNVTIDLVADGPHGLLAGTTGAGKSELLRSLVAGLAASVDSEHLNFVLVDYKGGSAFDACARLPHTVGLVTDLDGHLARRALVCLEAELRHREKRLRELGRENIEQFHIDPEGDPLPRLLVVVDEFAALARELPDFMDALVDMAQRGRSLGVHLLLATQRPHGVVSDAIRANTNLRVSLRVQSSADSVDVIGRPDAAAIGRSQPGRGLARLGADDVVAFQTAIVSLPVSGRRAGPLTRPFRLLPVETSIEDTAGDPGPTDLDLLVEAIRGASVRAGHRPPRLPWPPSLPDEIVSDDLPGGSELAVFGVADDPHHQRRVPLGWSPAAGHLLMYGVPGSGTSTALGSLATGLARRFGPESLHVYVIDCDDQTLTPLRDLDIVGGVVEATDTERQLRLLRMLTDEIVARRAVPDADRPEIVLIVDNYGGLIAGHDGPDEADVRARLTRLFADGPGVGVTVVATAKQPADIPHRVASLAPSRLAFRLTDRFELKGLGIESTVDLSPPGRVVSSLTQLEAQIALPHRDGLAAAVSAIPADPGIVGPPQIGVLPDEVKPADVTASARVFDLEWTVPVGIGDRDLSPIGFVLHPGDHLLVVGPMRSGRTTTLASIAHVVRHASPGVSVVAITARRSPLADVPEVDVCFTSATPAVAAIDPSKSTLLLVDDAELVDDDGALATLIAGRGDLVHVVAAGTTELLRTAYGHWTQAIRRGRQGIVLHPSGPADGELLAASLPRRGPQRWVPGRGYVMRSGEVELVQVAGRW